MPRSLRPIGHEDRLSLVDHLDELRTRLMICGGVLIVALGISFWQNHELLRIINKPLKTQTQKQVSKGEGTVGQAVLAQQAIIKTAQDTRAALSILAAPASGLPPHTREQLAPLASRIGSDVAKVPRNPSGDKPVTLGVGEPFTTTLKVSLYFALIISLPLILYQLAGFVLPALAPNEKRAIVPLLAAVPLLFAAGVAFGYFVVLPAAVHFFVNFNSGEFNVLVQANQFYGFAATILIAMGIVFQVPTLIVGATRLGLVTPAQLRKQRRYAVLLSAVGAAFVPSDVITMALVTLPLYLLYEASILLAAALGIRDRRRAASSGGGGGEGETARAPEPQADDAAPPTVQQMIDHVDNDLS
ncbi:MAG TPA: twin-arginine translocase subunit TatC [Solirubrobacteraceae bacterium]